ncbi:hypothetical protein [Paenibacillus sp. Leaf72]|uniref:hypothetical protein n=1 Tax=Paenibacillus sp. Leaf72 TaxID=1736234 RepID=UPI0007001AF4|nr:hypothetical protein [Paenibacillus sp. Leaf72]KQN97604.1 hypothetical protein ASF12_20540 [Paenibacillus sp. Leaf72]
MSRNYISLSVLLLIITFALFGCAKNEIVEESLPSPENQSVMFSSTSPSLEPSVEPTPSPSPSPSPEIGPAVLGANAVSFDKEFGERDNDDNDSTMWTYDDGRIFCLGYDFTCVNLSIAFDRIPLEEALAETLTMSPEDAVEVSRSDKTDDGTTYTYVVYKSEMLAAQFDADSFGDSEPGTFLVILKADKDGVFSSVQALGNRP